MRKRRDASSLAEAAPAGLWHRVLNQGHLLVGVSLAWSSGTVSGTTPNRS